VSRAPRGIERFPPCRVENADESEGADDEKRPLQNFRVRCVYAEMVEQRQVGECPKRDESGPIEENATDGDPRARSSSWSACRSMGVLPFAQWLAVPGPTQSDASRAGRGIHRQWKPVRHDPCPLAAIQIAVLKE